MEIKLEKLKAEAKKVKALCRKMTPSRWVFFGVVVLAILLLLSGGRGGEDMPAVVEETSPRPAPEFPLASQQNDLLKIAVEAQGFEGKTCYLTFDDGPTTTVTPKLLDVLKQYNVKATFFVMGKMLNGNREIGRRIHEEGHLLANHSYSHDYRTVYETPESFLSEVEQAENVIREVSGEEPFKLFRFPGGSQNAGAYAEEKQKYKLLLQEKGYYYADWNALNGDAEGDGRRSAQQLLARIKGTATQRNIVVLMHDAAAKKSTAEALPSIIEYLKSQGYQFKRLDEVKYYRTPEETKGPSFIL